MRAVAALFALLSLAAAGAAGFELYQKIETDGLAHGLSATANRAPTQTQPDTPTPARRWPALFGEEPPAPAARAPEVVVAAPPAPPKPAPLPPLASMGYRLDGVVQTDSRVWALVADGRSTHLLSVGETLAPGVEVVAIDTGGVWLSRSGNPPELLAFPD